MKKNKKRYLLFLILLAITSCLKPPKDVQEINIIDLCKITLDELNKNKNNPKEQLNFFKEIQTNFQAVVNFNKNTTIFIKTIEAKPNPEDFAYTLSNNKLKVIRPIYITFEGRDFLFSFDNKKWYLDKSDPIKVIEGIKKDYYFYSKIDGNQLFIDYWMSFSLGRAPKIVDISKKKKDVIYLKKGIVFINDDEKKVTADLRNKILYVPANTIVSWAVSIDGNFIESISNESGTYIKSMQDIYIYIKNKMFSLSFDKEKWSINILSFNINPKVNVISVDDNNVFFDLKASVIYEKDKINFSLIKLLLDNYK